MLQFPKAIPLHMECIHMPSNVCGVNSLCHIRKPFVGKWEDGVHRQNTEIGALLSHVTQHWENNLAAPVAKTSSCIRLRA